MTLTFEGTVEHHRIARTQPGRGQRIDEFRRVIGSKGLDEATSCDPVRVAISASAMTKPLRSWAPMAIAVMFDGKRRRDPPLQEQGIDQELRSPVRKAEAYVIPIHRKRALHAAAVPT